jgi:hypothetical protein
MTTREINEQIEQGHAGAPTSPTLRTRLRI